MLSSQSDMLLKEYDEYEKGGYKFKEIKKTIRTYLKFLT